MANLAGGASVSPDPEVGEEIQNRLEVMEVRERLMESLPKDSVSMNMVSLSCVEGEGRWGGCQCFRLVSRIILLLSSWICVRRGLCICVCVCM